jgi:hypothetical protein
MTARKKPYWRTHPDQPRWQAIRHIGDTLPDYSGGFIYRDLRGQYPEEIDWIEAPPEGEEFWGENGFTRAARWTVYRISLDRMTEVPDPGTGKMLLVPAGMAGRDDLPNPLASYEEWWVKRLPSVASTCGEPVESLRAGFCSQDPFLRFQAYDSVAMTFGWDEFDSYPLSLTLGELNRRYRSEFSRMRHGGTLQ